MLEWNEKNWEEYRQLHISSGLADLRGSYLTWDHVAVHYKRSWEFYLKVRTEYESQDETTRQEVKLLKTFLNNKKIEKLLYEDN